MDRISPERRSENMARIGAKNTGPELSVRRLLHRLGFRFRLHRTDLPGKPDVVLPRWKTVVFIHGCFWHGHSCPRGSRPTTNVEYWDEKFRKNSERDARAVEALEAAGWRTLTVWQCELNDPESLGAKLRGIATCNARLRTFGLSPRSARRS